MKSINGIVNLDKLKSTDNAASIIYEIVAHVLKMENEIIRLQIFVIILSAQSILSLIFILALSVRR